MAISNHFVLTTPVHSDTQTTYTLPAVGQLTTPQAETVALDDSILLTATGQTHIPQPGG